MLVGCLNLPSHFFLWGDCLFCPVLWIFLSSLQCPESPLFSQPILVVRRFYLGFFLPLGLRFLYYLGSLLSFFWRVGVVFLGWCYSFLYIFRYSFCLEGDISRCTCYSHFQSLFPFPPVLMNLVLDTLFISGEDVSVYLLGSWSRFYLFLRGLLRFFILLREGFFSVRIQSALLHKQGSYVSWVHTKAKREVEYFVFPIRSLTKMKCSSAFFVR